MRKSLYDIPEDFRYMDTYLKERPGHSMDAFGLKHPKMDRARRAKLFMPFDALRGFDAKIDIARDSSEYCAKRLLDESEIADIDKSLRELYEAFIRNGRQLLPTYASITYFVPMADDGSGKYEDISGEVTGISPEEQYLLVDNAYIRFDSIYTINTR